MGQENLDEILNNEVKGAENAVRKMLLYYYSALEVSGVKDIKQYIATKIGKMIDLSEDQCSFIKANLSSNSKLKESLDNNIMLLENIENTKTLDIESIHIVKEFLKLLSKDLSNVD